MGLKDVIGLTDSVGKVADNLTTTKEEQEQFRTERLKLDMASDNALAKSVRPISLYISWAIVIAIAAASILKVEIDPWIVGQFLAMHGTILSFYFYSRRGEKIAEKNAVANIEIKKIEVKAQIKADKRAKRKEKRNGNS